MGRINRLCKEDGSALLIALIMLMVLTIIGVATMNTSTTEVMISGNYRTMKECFYNAEKIMEYAIAQDNIYANLSTTVGGSVSLPLTGDNQTSAALNENIFSNVKAASVTLRREGKAPTGKGESGRARYYYIDVTASGPANAECRQIVERWLPIEEG